MRLIISIIEMRYLTTSITCGVTLGNNVVESAEDIPCGCIVCDTPVPPLLPSLLEEACVGGCSCLDTSIASSSGDDAVEVSTMSDDFGILVFVPPDFIFSISSNSVCENRSITIIFLFDSVP